MIKMAKQQRLFFDYIPFGKDTRILTKFPKGLGGLKIKEERYRLTRQQKKIGLANMEGMGAGFVVGSLAGGVLGGLAGAVGGTFAGNIIGKKLYRKK
jgi:hypothetical protein